MQPDISVIIPVYKVEGYISNAIESIISQTITNIEIIIIDDGSPDKSGVISDEYAKKDGRIKVFHQQNQGVSSARNLGIELATGRYISFVDPDDWIEINMYKKLIEMADKNNYDIALFGYYIERDYDEKPKIILPEYTENLLEGFNEIYNSIIYRLILAGEGSANVWNMIYSSELIKSHNIRFDKIEIFEDYLFNMNALAHANKFVYIKEPLYHYRIINNSASRKFKRNMFQIVLSVQSKKESFFEQIGLLNDQTYILSAKWFIKHIEATILSEFSLQNPDSFNIRKERIRLIIYDDKVHNMSLSLRNKKQNKFLLYLLVKRKLEFLILWAITKGCALKYARLLRKKYYIGLKYFKRIWE